MNVRLFSSWPTKIYVIQSNFERKSRSVISQETTRAHNFLLDTMIQIFYVIFDTYIHVRLPKNSRRRSFHHLQGRRTLAKSTRRFGLTWRWSVPWRWERSMSSPVRPPSSRRRLKLVASWDTSLSRSSLPSCSPRRSLLCHPKSSSTSLELSSAYPWSEWKHLSDPHDWRLLLLSFQFKWKIILLATSSASIFLLYRSLHQFWRGPGPILIPIPRATYLARSGGDRFS